MYYTRNINYIILSRQAFEIDISIYPPLNSNFFLIKFHYQHQVQFCLSVLQNVIKIFRKWILVFEQVHMLITVRQDNKQIPLQIFTLLV